MDIITKLLIITILIFSTFNIVKYNSIFIAISMILLLIFSLKYSHTHSVLLSIIILLVVSNKLLTNKDNFSNYIDNQQSGIVTQSKYCVPLKNGVCPSPFNKSINDPNWCCLGNCYCRQQCPPVNCQKKYKWGACPGKGQVQSSDDPNMCCYGAGCKCNTNPTCPKATTCGYTPEEEEEEEIDPNKCPCDTTLKCTKELKVIPRSKQQMYSPPPPAVCKK